MEHLSHYRGLDEGKILYARNYTVRFCRYILVNITVKTHFIKKNAQLINR